LPGTRTGRRGTSKLATIVLVHGAHAGGWWWGETRDLLRRAGHAVFAPSLTGHGERSHLAGPGVTLGTHVQDVVNLLRYEELSGAVLVGWSYGGMVVAGAADREPHRLTQVVYGDALVPRDGEAAIDLVGGERRERVLALAAAGEHVIPLWPDAEERLVPQAIATWTEPLRLRGAAAGLARTFIHCTSPPHPAVIASFQRAVAEPGWRLREIAAGHSAPRERPREVAELLLDLVGS
jgi:pimeloyl-ACP methyl ester carboxylesterase